MRPARACAQTQSFVTPSRSATSSAVSRLVTVARSSFEPAAALSTALSLESPLGKLISHLRCAVTEVVLRHERASGVAALGLLAPKIVDATRGECLGATQLRELVPPAGEPAHVRSLGGASPFRRLGAEARRLRDAVVPLVLAAACVDRQCHR